MNTVVSPRDWQMLSEYVDGQLPEKERARLEARLAADSELRSVLEELRQTQAILRAAPRLRAPRNFTLTPAMASLKPRHGPSFSLFPAFRFASAIAAVLLVFTLAGDVLTSGMRTASLPPSESQGAPLAMQAAPTGAASEPGQLPDDTTVQSSPVEQPAAPLLAEALKAAPEGTPHVTATPESSSASGLALQGLPVEETAIAEMPPEALTATLPVTDTYITSSAETAAFTITEVLTSTTGSEDVLKLPGILTETVPLSSSAGMMNSALDSEQASGTAASEELEADSLAAAREAVEVSSTEPFWTPYRIMEVVLAGIVLVCALAAYWLRRASG